MPKKKFTPPHFDPEEDALPRWDDIKHTYSKASVDRHEKRIADVLKRAANKGISGK